MEGEIGYADKGDVGERGDVVVEVEPCRDESM